eukprot:1579399-Rhodomonas_salina.1
MRRMLAGPLFTSKTQRKIADIWQCASAACQYADVQAGGARVHRRDAAIYGHSAAIYAGNAAVYGGNSAILGDDINKNGGGSQARATEPPSSSGSCL